MKYSFILLIMIAILASCNTHSQNIQKDASGNYHQLKAPSHADTATLTPTGSTYTTTNGEVYPVYQSARGKFFIIRVSKNTGKQYKQYLKL